MKASYAAVPEERRRQYLQLVEDRFGISTEVFSPFHFFQAGKRFLMIASISPDAVPTESAASVGIPFMRVNLPFPKLTTSAAAAFGRHASKNTVPLTLEETRAFVRRESLRLDDVRLARCTGKGYVIVTHRDVPLGIGFLNAAERELRSLYPRRWSPAP